VFVKCEIYKERKIFQLRGGSPVQNMTMKSGRVTCIFTPDVKGHYYMQVAVEKNSIKAALTLMEQTECVPAFIIGLTPVQCVKGKS